MINDIKENLDVTYKLPKEYYSKSKYELNKECDKLFLEGKFLQLKNTRQFIKDNFRLERYESFVFENRDLAKILLKKNDLDETDRVYIRINSDYDKIGKELEVYEFLEFITKNTYSNDYPLYAIQGIKRWTRKAKICDILNIKYEYNIYRFFKEYEKKITEIID
jgi:hypothetical protein